LRSRGEIVTLIGIKVCIIGIEIPLSAGISRVSTPSDTKLNIVVLESDEREGGLLYSN
jgi:hypothetical protein